MIKRKITPSNLARLNLFGCYQLTFKTPRTIAPTKIINLPTRRACNRLLALKNRKRGDVLV